MAVRDYASSTLPREVCKVKLILVGNSNVGKTSLIMRFVEKRFSDSHQYTIGATFTRQTVTVDGITIQFEIWDTAGQERYRSMMPMYYRGAQAAVVVYDITNNETFNVAKSWMKELRNHAEPNVIISLAGNKADLEEKRAVQTAEAQAYAEENELLFMETSAKTDMNVEDLFIAIAKKLPKSSRSLEYPVGNPEDLHVSGHKQSTRGGGSCCRR